MKVIKFGSVAGNNIFPDKIKEARTSRGLSLAQLSELIGVSSQAISQYERGEIIPNPSVTLKIVEALDFPINFFTSQNENNLKDEVVYFRSNKNISKKLKEACRIRIKWIDNTYKMISKYFDLPQVNLPNFEKFDIDNLDLIKIEEIADSLRKYWGLGEYPIKNLVDVLQRNGFVVTKLKVGSKKIDGFSTWIEGTPYIFIGSDKGSAVRSRFDLAHELGHLILHRNLSKEDFEEEGDILEKQADMFASALLLPREAFNSEMITSSIDSFILLKKKWLVSISAMIRRAQDTEMLTENQIRYLRSQMIKYGYYKKEPMDDTISPERPYLFKQAFDILLDNNIMSKEEILDSIKLNREEAISLYSLRENFFDNKDNILMLVK